MLHLLLTTMSCSLLWIVLVVDPKGAAAMSPDGLALLYFKRNLINGDEVLSSWNGSDDGPCGGSWRGVTCAPPGSNPGVVSELSLTEGAGLIGDLSMARSLGLIPNLTTLRLIGQKELTGSIPPEIFNAARLTLLDLSRNSLNGSIPSLDGLTDLNWLDVQANHLSGPIPNVTHLTKLQALHLGNGNNLVATMGDAPDLANMNELVSITLSGCQIVGSMPTWIGSMPGLRRLDMSNNQLSGPIPWDVWRSSSFDTVDLSSNRLNGSIPAALFPQLQRAVYSTILNLSNNALTGPIPDSLNLTSWPSPTASQPLFSLDVSNNQLSGTIPPTLVQGAS